MDFDPSDLVRDAEQGRRIAFFEEELRVCTRGEENDGVLDAGVIATPPGAGPPLHAHREQEEFFYVLEGTFEVQIDGGRREATAGDTLLVPRGTPHAYRNAGDREGRFLGILVPGGALGLFEDLSELEMPPDIEAVETIFDRHDVDLEGPPLDDAD